MNTSLIKIAVSDSQMKPNTIFIPLSKQFMNIQKLIPLKYPTFIHGHDTFELAEACVST